MDNLYFVSIIFEAATILACTIFIVLLLTTRLLPKKVNSYGLLVFISVLFISAFYLTINLEWYEIAKPLIWLFVPASISLSLYFYKFNTIWMKEKASVDPYLNAVPLMVLITAIVLEICNYSSLENDTIKAIRISFTENTLRFLFPIFTGFLILLNFVKIKKAEQSNKEQYVEEHLVNLNWSRISLVFFTLFYTGMILSELTNPIVSELIFNISILTLTLYLGYYQIKVIARYLNSINNSKKIVEDKPTLTSSKSDRLSSIFKDLDKLTNDELLFLKTDLTIHELGVKLNLNSKYLSEAINKNEGLNFNRYINLKRLDYAKKIMFDDDYKNYSLEGIAQESGFKSKSTFNTLFKKMNGITPSEYRKKGLSND